MSSVYLTTVVTDTPLSTTMVYQSDTPSNQSTSSSSKHINIGAIVGGVVAGVVIAVIAVAMIVPCARRRQRKIRDPADGYGDRVLRKATDAEASEPMMNGSWRDYSRISEEDRMRSLGSSNTAVIPPGYIESLPVPAFPSLQPVSEGVVMTESPYYQHPSATQSGQPIPATWAGRESSKSALPRFPSLDRLWPLTSAFRTSIYSSPSTKTKSSGASSAPSRATTIRPSTKRGRSGEQKEINPDALTSPTVLGHELGLGRGRAAMDKEIKHANTANDVTYQTAPMHRGYSLKRGNSIPSTTAPVHREPPIPYVQPPRPSYSQDQSRRRPSDSSEPRQHQRKKSADSPRRLGSHSRQQSATRHHSRQNSAEHAARAAHRSRSRSRSRNAGTGDNSTEVNKKVKVPHAHDPRRLRSSQAQVHEYPGQPS